MSAWSRRGGYAAPAVELHLPAPWPEDWREWHTHGLECILMSGRVAASLFIEPLDGSASQILRAFPGRDPGVPWNYFVAGRLLAGVGAEILLKGGGTRRRTRR